MCAFNVGKKRERHRQGRVATGWRGVATEFYLHRLSKISQKQQHRDCHYTTLQLDSLTTFPILTSGVALTSQLSLSTYLRRTSANMPAAPKHSSKHHRKPNPTSNPSNGSGNGGPGNAGPSRSPHTPHVKPMEERDQAGVPGISKLKASIRQTKRLLAKVRAVWIGVEVGASRECLDFCKPWIPLLA